MSEVMIAQNTALTFMKLKLDMDHVVLGCCVRQQHSDTSVVLVHLPNNSCTPYVTWVIGNDDKACYWGHYHNDLEEAYMDFVDRIGG